MKKKDAQQLPLGVVAVSSVVGRTAHLVRSHLQCHSFVLHVPAVHSVAARSFEHSNMSLCHARRPAGPLARMSDQA